MSEPKQMTPDELTQAVAEYSGYILQNVRLCIQRDFPTPVSETVSQVLVLVLVRHFVELRAGNKGDEKAQKYIDFLIHGCLLSLISSLKMNEFDIPMDCPPMSEEMKKSMSVGIAAPAGVGRA